MYVESMSADEMVQEFRRDVEQSMAWCGHRLRNDVRRLVTKVKSYPFTLCRRWVSKGGNEYIVSFSVRSKRMKEDKRALDSYVSYMALLWRRDGWWLFDANNCCQGDRMMTADGMRDTIPHMYTAHFLDRYAMRKGRDVRFQTVMDQFAHDVASKEIYTSAVGVGEYQSSHGGDAEVLSMYRGGYMLGVVKDGMALMQTFYDNDIELTERQKKYFNDMAQSHLKLQEAYDTLERVNKQRRGIVYV